jgi:hypothetical protein
VLKNLQCRIHLVFTVHLPQARKLLPIVRPDYIVVDVDETDLNDDFARYRKLIVRNERGQNVGVKVSPIGHACSVGLMEARGHALYLTRFVAKLWLSLVRMPSLIEEYRSDFTLFSYSQDHGADLEQKYSEALSVFRQNLQELAGILRDYTQQLRFLQCHPDNEAAGRIGPREVLLELRYAF